MDFMDSLLFVMDLIGTAAFAAAGAMVAIKANADLFGVVICAIFTAQGGGATRDILLGSTPPRMFRDYTDLTLAVITALLVFIAVRLLKERLMNRADAFDRVVNIFDAAGLAVFVVNGMNVAADCGLWDNAPLTVLMGMCSAIGGGVLRDVLLRRMPFVLQKQFYATACLIGGVLYYAMIQLNLPAVPAILTSMLTIFVLRMLATRYRWDLPKALPKDYMHK